MSESILELALNEFERLEAFEALGFDIGGTRTAVGENQVFEAGATSFENEASGGFLISSDGEAVEVERCGVFLVEETGAAQL